MPTPSRTRRCSRTGSEASGACGAGRVSSAGRAWSWPVRSRRRRRSSWLSITTRPTRSRARGVTDGRRRYSRPGASARPISRGWPTGSAKRSAHSDRGRALGKGSDPCGVVSKLSQPRDEVVRPLRRNGREKAASGLRVEEKVGPGAVGQGDVPGGLPVRVPDRRADAARGKFRSTPVERDGVEVDPGGDPGSPGDAQKMPGEAEAGDVGHRAGACETGGRIGLRPLHRSEKSREVVALRLQVHVGREQNAAAEGAGEDERVSRPRAVEPDGPGLSAAGDGEAD